MGRKVGFGKKFKCLECFNCKTRVFRTPAQVRAWCSRWSIVPKQVWINDVINLGFLRLIWCPLHTDHESPQGFSPRNASPKHTIAIEDVLKLEKKMVVVSNRNKKTFIPYCLYSS